MPLEDLLDILAVMILGVITVFFWLILFGLGMGVIIGVPIMIIKFLWMLA